MSLLGKSLRLSGLLLSMMSAPLPAAALQGVSFDVSGGDAALTATLKNSSLLAGLQASGRTEPQDILAAALADYGRLLDALYAEGHYGGVITIHIDGREAAAIQTFAVPDRVQRVTVRVVPGPQFRFATADVGPLPAGATPLPGFARGEPAPATVIREAVASGVSDWRDAGHAKATISAQALVADHRNATLSADIRLAPGPRVTFGRLNQRTPSAVRSARIDQIAGLPTGETFSPRELQRVAERLRRTGAFSSVALSEAETLGPGNTMDINVDLADEPPRRFGFGAEVSSREGVALSGYWLHRNLLGGAERFRAEANVAGIDGTLAGMDAAVSARLDIPAALGTDTDVFVFAEAAYEDEPNYLLIEGSARAGIRHRFSDRLKGEIAASYGYTYTDDDLGQRRFSVVSLPSSLTWDGRNDPLDPSSGLFVDADIEPFYDIIGSQVAARGYVDGRAYLGLGGDDQFVLAARAQAGVVIGAVAAAVPPDMLFFSGGGGTVRGFPYQSLGIDQGGGTIVGGRAFLGASGEIRYRISDSFGAVAFVDAGHIGQNTFFDAGGDWQIGAGVGLRYYTGMGPVRLDVALPVEGPGGDGMQFYIGIGQSF